jgi:hypothetical protein
MIFEACLNTNSLCLPLPTLFIAISDQTLKGAEETCGLGFTSKPHEMLLLLSFWLCLSSLSVIYRTFSRDISI